MANPEPEIVSVPDREPLSGFRLLRLEMLNWGTFHGKVARLEPAGHWTLLVGENGSGKSTAVDALRTLLVPPRLLNYNDASGEQRRRDRTRRSYVRGTWGTSSQEESATAIPQHLRSPGEYSVLLAVFANERTGRAVTLAQVLWELNEKIDDVYAIAREERSIPEHLATLGASRELRKTLRNRGFEPFESFSAYSERFRSLLGIPNDTALEVFNQAIGVKEVLDINHFIRRHMLEGSDVLDFIHTRLRPHYNELDACWRAIERAEKQLAALEPIAACHRRIEEATARQEEIERLANAAPLYYTHRHLDLRDREAAELAARMEELNRDKAALEEARRRDEAEHAAKLKEIAADTTQQSIDRIESRMETANERLKSRQQRRSEFNAHLTTLDRAQDMGSEADFASLKADVEAHRGAVEGNRKAAEDKLLRLAVEKHEADRERERLTTELDALRRHKVLIPSVFVSIREAVATSCSIPVDELPFAGELMEVKAEHRDWTGAIERLLHQLGVSMLVPERHHVLVARFINVQHLGQRFTFHRVPVEAPELRAAYLASSDRVSGRLNFREDHPLTGWLKADVSRRFNHVCCPDVQRLREVDYGLTREGLIRDGPTRHTKDDRRAVNDVTNYVLGWSVEGKIHGLITAIGRVEVKALAAGQKVADAKRQVDRLDAQLVATRGVLATASYADIDFRSVQLELARLTREREELESSSEKLGVLKGQLASVQLRLEANQKQIMDVMKSIGSVEDRQTKNAPIRARLATAVAQVPAFDAARFAGEFAALQEDGSLTIDTIKEIEEQVSARLRHQAAQQRGVINTAEREMLPRMADFLRDYPEHTVNLQARSEFAADFAVLRGHIERDELPAHRQRFEEFLGTNLVGDTAMFQSKLLEHETTIRQRVEGVNHALREIPFSDGTHVQIVIYPTRADDVRQFRAELKECLAGGLNPTPDDRARIFTRIRELMAKFEKDDTWTRRVTDARQWLEFGVREIATQDGREVQFYSGSSGKSGGQKAKLAFTILASAISAQYRLLGAADGADTFRLVVIDEAFARTDEANSQRALELFKTLDLQLIVVNPFDAKGRIVEDYVESFHLTVNPDENNSRLRRASRAEYESVRDGRAHDSVASVTASSAALASVHAQPE